MVADVHSNSVLADPVLQVHVYHVYQSSDMYEVVSVLVAGNSALEKFICQA
jgi:hypothetical protein